MEIRELKKEDSVTILFRIVTKFLQWHLLLD